MEELKKRHEEVLGKVEKIELKRCIRVNTLRADPDQLAKRLAKKSVKLTKIIPVENAYFVEKSPFNLVSSAEYLLGYFYMQELASQLPAIALAPRQNEKILDMCASPGSKTTQIASIMKNTGVIVALENNYMRINKLKNNIERLGITNCLVYNKDARFVSDLGLRYDRVLLDAPCSGNFIIDPKWFDKRAVADFKKMQKTQKELLRAAVSVVKKGGIVVYSTCSLEIEENEQVIEWALDELGVTIVDTKLPIGVEGIGSDKLKLCRRFYPPKTETQGFFIAKLKKE